MVFFGPEKGFSEERLLETAVKQPRESEFSFNPTVCLPQDPGNPEISPLKSAVWGGPSSNYPKYPGFFCTGRSGSIPGLGPQNLRTRRPPRRVFGPFGPEVPPEVPERMSPKSGVCLGVSEGVHQGSFEPRPKMCPKSDLKVSKKTLFGHF